MSGLQLATAIIKDELIWAGPIPREHILEEYSAINLGMQVHSTSTTASGTDCRRAMACHSPPTIKCLAALQLTCAVAAAGKAVIGWKARTGTEPLVLRQHCHCCDRRRPGCLPSRRSGEAWLSSQTPSLQTRADGLTSDCACDGEQDSPAGHHHTFP